MNYCDMNSANVSLENGELQEVHAFYFEVDSSVMKGSQGAHSV